LLKIKFKLLYFTVCFLLCLLVSSISWADCNVNDIEYTNIDDFKDTLSSAFPFSVIVFAGDILDDISSISPLSPASFSFSVFGTEYTPLAFIESETVDGLFQAFRILILAGAIFALAKHVLEYIL